MRVDLTDSLSSLLPKEAFGFSVPSSLPAALRTDVETIIAPGSVEEVAMLLQWASERGVGVVPIGTGGHTYPRRPSDPFIVLTTSRLNEIQHYEPADLTMTAGAGVLIRDLATEMAIHGQWLPFDPPDVRNRTLGGLVATGLSGPLWAGYGQLRNHVLGATIVCGNGQTLRLGGKVVKNVAGFDILKPMVGSRGELAIITSATVRIFPLPVVDRLLVLEAADISELVPTARAIATAPIMPASVSLRATSNRSRLLVRLHGAQVSVDSDQKSLEKHTSVSFEVRDSPEDQSLMLEEKGGGMNTGLAVRVWALPSRIDALLDVLKQVPGASLNADVYGGSVRAYLPEQISDIESSLTGLQKDIEELGGTMRALQIPAEVNASAYFTKPLADEGELASGLKRAFDPQSILWGIG